MGLYHPPHTHLSFPTLNLPLCPNLFYIARTLLVSEKVFVFQRVVEGNDYFLDTVDVNVNRKFKGNIGNKVYQTMK